jgi:hypothetical protein
MNHNSNISIVIDKIPESLNRILNWHWAKRKKYKDIWETLIWVEVYNKKIKPIRGQVKIKITFVFNNKHKHDWDNTISGCKGIFDSLKKYVIDDDSMDIIRKIEFDYKISDKQQTLIEIWRLNDPDRKDKM